MGPGVAIVDPAKTCAELIAASLPSQHTPSSSAYRFFASDDAGRFKDVGEAFLGMKMGKVGTVDQS